MDNPLHKFQILYISLKHKTVMNVLMFINNLILPPPHPSQSYQEDNLRNVWQSAQLVLFGGKLRVCRSGESINDDDAIKNV